MNVGFFRPHVGLYVSVLLCCTKKKSSVTSTLVVDKSTLQIFKRLVVAYRKIEERLAYIVHISNDQYRILVSYLLCFRKKSCLKKEIIATYLIFKNKKTMHDNGCFRPGSD